MPDAQTDHDLIVSMKAEFGTKLDRVIKDVADLKDNLVSRVEILEKDKIDNDKYSQSHRDLESKVEKQDARVDALENWRAAYLITSSILSGGLVWLAIEFFKHISK